MNTIKYKMHEFLYNVACAKTRAEGYLISLISLGAALVIAALVALYGNNDQAVVLFPATFILAVACVFLICINIITVPVPSVYPLNEDIEKIINSHEVKKNKETERAVKIHYSVDKEFYDKGDIEKTIPKIQRFIRVACHIDKLKKEIKNDQQNYKNIISFFEKMPVTFAENNINELEGIINEATSKLKDTMVYKKQAQLCALNAEIALIIDSHKAADIAFIYFERAFQYYSKECFCRALFYIRKQSEMVYDILENNRKQGKPEKSIQSISRIINDKYKILLDSFENIEKNISHGGGVYGIVSNVGHCLPIAIMLNDLTFFLSMQVSHNDITKYITSTKCAFAYFWGAKNKYIELPSVMCNFSFVLTRYGEKNGPPALIQEAVGYYTDALKKITPQSFKADIIENNIAVCLFHLSAREFSLEKITLAINYLTSVVCKEGHTPTDRAMFFNNIAICKAQLSQQSPDIAILLCEGIRYLRKAKKMYKYTPHKLGRTLNNLGVLVNMLGNDQNKDIYVRRALSYLQVALEIRSPNFEYLKVKSLENARTLYAIGEAHFVLYNLTRFDGHIKKSIDAYDKSISQFESGIAQIWKGAVLSRYLEATKILGDKEKFEKLGLYQAELDNITLEHGKPYPWGLAAAQKAWIFRYNEIEDWEEKICRDTIRLTREGA